MLRTFHVSNHRSLKGEQEFSLLPVLDRQRVVTPVTGVFGANASGKTAFVDALAFMRTAVVNSVLSWPEQGGVPRSPFRLDLDSLSAPSDFKVDLELDGTRFEYGFSVDDERVLAEHLYSWPVGRKRVIFTRQGDEIEFGSTIHDPDLRNELVGGVTRANGLALSTAAQLKIEEVAPVYRWFRSSLSVYTRREREGLASHRSLASIFRRRPRIVELIRAADIGITDVRVEEVEKSLSGMEARLVKQIERELAETAKEDGMQDRLRHQLDVLMRPRVASRVLFQHGASGVPLDPEDESDGTLAWIRLMDLALDALERGGLLVVDEIDASLHPRLTSRLVEVFQDSEINGRCGQLVFTSHDSSLMNPVLGTSNLARDEVWFVEKDEAGASVLFALTDFRPRPRKEDNLERKYLTGVYGGVPNTSQWEMRQAFMTAMSSGERSRRAD